MNRKYIILLFLFLINYSFAEFKDVRKTILPNGLAVIRKQCHNLPIVTVDMWVKTGSINEGEKNNGISHFIEHLLFKTTEKRKAGDIYKEIEAVSGKINASTSYDFTHFYVTVPKEYLKLALDILYDMLFHPKFLEEDFNSEREVVTEEMKKLRDEPYRYLDEIFRKTIYKVSTYRRPIIGYEEILNSLTLQDIIDYYQKYYVASNMVLIIVGDFDEQELMNTIEELFGKEKESSILPIEYEEEKELDEIREIVTERDVKYAHFILGYLAPSIKEEDDVYAMDLILMILGEGRSSRLYQRLKEEKGLVLEISTEFLTQKNKGTFAIVGKCKEENIEKVKEEILKEIERIKTKGVKIDELDKAKNLLEAQVVFDIETTSGLCSYFGFYEVLGDLKFGLSYLDKIRAVKPHQIKATANKYFTKNYVFCVLRPKVQ